MIHEDGYWLPLFPGVYRHTIGAGERLMQMEVRLDEGAQVPVHSHPHEQSSYIVSGRLRFTVNGTTREVGPGDLVHIPGGAAHAVTVIEPALVIDTFSPPREDLLAIDAT